MKLLSAQQIHELDQYTIENEPIASIELMERAARACTDFLMSNYEGLNFYIVAGTGNNGGDGLAIARQLDELKQSVRVCVIGRAANGSTDFKTNLERLKLHPKIKIEIYNPEENVPEEELEEGVLVDALFGTGLTRPAEGGYKKVIKWINELTIPVVSIDLPSGMSADLNPIEPGTVVQAQHTLSFQIPKIPFLFDDHRSSAGRVHILDIGLDKEYHQKMVSDQFFLTRNIAQKLRRKRTAFSHKRSYGHVLLAAGSDDKMGAAILAAEAVMRGGAGLLTAHIPASGANAMNTVIPEAMLSLDADENNISRIGIEDADVTVLGPGMGIKPETEKALGDYLSSSNAQLILDADALNMLAVNEDWWQYLKGRAILTPHPGEFDRLTGSGKHQIDQYRALKKFAAEKEVVIILKGAFSRVAFPNGETYFNSTGNPGMATAGSGDVLAGLCGGILGAGYSLEDAALLAVYLHGKAGDLCADDNSQEALTARMITAHLGKAWKSLD